jgi:hypothetical protein
MSLQADAALVGVGWWVRSRTVIDRYGDPAGGIVCHVDRQHVADDDGEIHDLALYRVRNTHDIDPLGARILDGSDIDPAGAAPASYHDAATLTRRVCFELGKTRRRSGIARELRPAELSALRDVVAVLSAVAG